jgi:hypothetical protein
VVDDQETTDVDADNDISFAPDQAAQMNGGANVDDDDLITCASKKIADLKAAGTPRLSDVQELFHKSICAGASPMARDKIVSAILAALGNAVGSKRALIGTWNKLVKDDAVQRAQDARESTTRPELTPAQKAALRESLWLTVRELAEAPDLMDRVVKQVHAMGVVGECELITLTYIAATSRVLDHPINILARGASSGGKSFTVFHTLELIGPDFTNQLTSSSALSLVYDTRPLAHTVIFLFEANQLQVEKQGDKDSTFAMLVRTLISEGRIIHQTTVEDPNSPTGRRVERIVRDGPISFICTTTGSLYDENETRMLAWNIHEDPKQTAAVMAGLAARASGAVVASPDLALWHDLQRWIGLGPNDAVIPFAPQIAKAIPPAMVRFRRDTGSLFTFIKASALLHQTQRQMDANGRVVATVADYALAFPIYSRVMAETAGKGVPANVHAVVKLIEERAGAPAEKPEEMRFKRVEVAGRASEVTVSSEEIGTAVGVGRWPAYRAVISAIDRGFLINNETRKGKPFRLVIKRGIDEAAPALLPDPKTISPEGGAT